MASTPAPARRQRSESSVLTPFLRRLLTVILALSGLLALNGSAADHAAEPVAVYDLHRPRTAALETTGLAAAPGSEGGHTGGSR